MFQEQENFSFYWVTVKKQQVLALRVWKRYYWFKVKKHSMRMPLEQNQRTNCHNKSRMLGLMHVHPLRKDAQR